MKLPSLRKVWLLGVATIMAGGLAWAAAIPPFQAGPRLIDGSDLNSLVNVLNNLTGNGTPQAGTFTTVTYTGNVSDTAATGGLVNGVTIAPQLTGTIPTINAGGTNADSNLGLAVAGSGTGTLLLGGNTTTLAGLQVAQTASRVNDVIVTPGATGAVPTITSGGAGADANISLQIAASGTGQVNIGGTTTTGGLQVAQTASAVNDVVVTNGATGTAPLIKTGGASADANRNLTLAGNGTGIVALGSAAPITCTAADTVTANCNGQHGIATFTAVTVAAVTDKSETIGNTSVSASSQIICTLVSFTGTLVTNGIPVVTECVPGSGTITVHITNAHASNTTGSQSFLISYMVL